MAKKNAKNTERRAMVEQMRAEQARKERMRSLAILGTCMLVVIGLLGIAVVKYVQDQRAENKVKNLAISKIGDTKAVASCDAVKTTKTDKNQTHVPAPTPITYNDAPPAFGPHRPTPAPFGRPFYTSDRPEIAELVHNEEHGFTIAWYDDTAAADKDQMTALKQIAQKYQDAKQKFIAAPWHSSDGDSFPDGKHIALTRWSADKDKPTDESKQRGNWEYCGSVSGEAISEFFKMWTEDEAPENIPIS